MPSIDDVYTSNNLKSGDIDGKEPRVKIASVVVREFKEPDGKTKDKLVLGFAGTKKTMVLNKTNVKRIAAMHGKDYSQWPGKMITLFVDHDVEFGGKSVPGLRVKPQTYEPPRQESPAPPAPTQPTPFDDPMPELDTDDSGAIPF